jgi:hypothetical protein
MKALEAEEKSIKDSYDNRVNAINDYYDDIDAAERQQERTDKLADLQKEEAKYANAATREGKERLQKIRDEIKDINKETEKAIRDTEKKKELDKAEADRDTLEEDRLRRLEVLNEDYKNLDKAQKEMLDNISSYANESADAIDKVTAKIKTMLQVLSGIRISGQTSSKTGTDKAVSGSIIVNVNDYGAKNISNKEEAIDYVNELFTAAENAARQWGIAL